MNSRTVRARLKAAMSGGVVSRRTSTIRAKSITCSPFFSQQLISYCITVGVAARNFFQLQLQPRSLHGIISNSGYSRGRGTERP